MRKILMIIVCLLGASTLLVLAEDATEDAKTEKHENAGTHPYLFFFEQNGEDLLIVYEQWTQKKPEDPSVLTVRRKVGKKSDIINFTVKVEALKEGLCRFRILEHKIDDPTVTKAKELLGIKSDFFEIRFRETPGQMSKILLSVKDSDTSERGDADEPATAPQFQPSGNKAEQTTANPLLTLPQELIGRHHGAMGQFGQATKDKPLSFGDDDITLGGIELKADGELIVPFALKGESFKDLSFKFHENHVSGAVAVWNPLQDGNDRYSATLSRYGSVFRVLVKLQREDGSVAAIQWICAEPRKTEANDKQKVDPWVGTYAVYERSSDDIYSPSKRYQNKVTIARKDEYYTVSFAPDIKLQKVNEQMLNAVDQSAHPRIVDLQVEDGKRVLVVTFSFHQIFLIQGEVPMTWKLAP